MSEALLNQQDLPEELAMLEQWLHLWSHWMDQIVSVGLANLNDEIKRLIYLWAIDANDLGFNISADLAQKLMSDEPLIDKTTVFQQLTLQHSLVCSGFDAEVIRYRYG